MQSLTSLDNEQRARLYFSLFPEMITPFLQTVAVITEKVIHADIAQLSQNWELPIISPQQWRFIAETFTVTVQKLQEEKKKQKPDRIARLFFIGLSALFAVHCLYQLETIHQGEENAVRCIRVFFG